MTKKNLFSAILLAAMSVPAMAGGLTTNSNQNAAFLRNFAQEGTITLSSIYANPAGGAFLSPGWHLSLNVQSAYQSRDIKTTFPYFVQNQDNPTQTHKFEGDAKAPVVPSFTLSWNHDKWSLSAHFALTGGGGKCQFDEGLGTFETAYSSLTASLVPTVLPNLVASTLINQGYDATTATAVGNTASYTGYTLNSFMKGRNYYFGLQIGATYKFLDNLAGFIGLRGVYANNNYAGSVNPTAYYTIGYTGTSGSAALNDYGVVLDCDQTGFSASPILGIDWKINKHWNVSAKYEFKTRMKLKNSTRIDVNETVAAQAQSILKQYEDGRKVREDMPGLLTFGAQYSPIDKVRLSAGFHEYFDKQSTRDAFDSDGNKYNRNDEIEHNTWELVAGAEYDCCKLITVSASWQRTKYGLGDNYLTDLSFNNSNNSMGVGMRIHPSKYFNIDVGYMHTFYQDKTVTTMSGAKTDVYSRKNDVFGVGFNIYL